jgi:uncharacterized membrane protein YbhN (UPF0104 family)
VERPKNKKSIKLIVSIVLTLALIILTVVYVRDHLSEFRELWQQPLPPLIIICLIVLTALGIFLNCEIIRVAFKAHRLNMGFLEGLALAASTSAANYFIPLKGGVGLRALYLSRRHKLPLTSFISQVTAVGLMTLTMSSLFGFSGLTLMSLTDNQNNPTLTLYFGTTFLLGLFVFLLPKILIVKARLPQFIAARLIRLTEERDRYLNTQGLILRLLGLDFIYLLNWSLSNLLAFQAFDIHISLYEAMFLTAGQIHATIVNLTPAGLGLVEAFSIYAGEILKFTPPEALMAQALSRTLSVILLILSGLWGWLYLSSFLARPDLTEKGRGD